MFALFDTLEEYLGKNTEISEAVRCPEGTEEPEFEEVTND